MADYISKDNITLDTKYLFIQSSNTGKKEFEVIENYNNIQNLITKAFKENKKFTVIPIINNKDNKEEEKVNIEIDDTVIYTGNNNIIHKDTELEVISIITENNTTSYEVAINHGIGYIESYTVTGNEIKKV